MCNECTLWDLATDHVEPEACFTNNLKLLATFRRPRLAAVVLVRKFSLCCSTGAIKSYMSTWSGILPATNKPTIRIPCDHVTILGQSKGKVFPYLTQKQNSRVTLRNAHWGTFA